MAPHPKRDFVVSRAGFRCEYCHTPEEWLPFRLHVDHVVALQHRGGDENSNLAATCVQCNSNKGPNLASIDPVTDALTLLFNPRLHQWADHFSIAGERIMGRTPMGRATVMVLNMNAAAHMERRRNRLLIGQVITE
jgi:hypothetical protein